MFPLRLNPQECSTLLRVLPGKFLLGRRWIERHLQLYSLPGPGRGILAILAERAFDLVVGDLSHTAIRQSKVARFLMDSSIVLRTAAPGYVGLIGVGLLGVACDTREIAVTAQHLVRTRFVSL